MKHGHRWLIGALGVTALAIALAAIAAVGQDSLALDGTTYYVDADASGLNDGSSWGNAFTTLQAALEAAGTDDQIWVAEGTYKPTIEHGGTGDRYKSFQMVNGVAIYGGFDPSVGDIAWEDRDWDANETILSGDLNGDDGPDFENNEENSYHVFYHPEEYTDLDTSAILDGFTITGGNANGAPPHHAGGGMFNDGSSPTLTNCTFSDNWAGYGGGMDNTGSSSPVLTDCTFMDNSASNSGGGMFNSGSPILTGCTFVDNSASNHGGGMYNLNSSPMLTDCTFSANSAGDGGGGMFNDASSPTLTDCTFSGNSADGGGGMGNVMYSSPVLVNCAFEGNWVGSYGGGGMLNYDSSPTLTNCTFSANSSVGSGGGIHNGYSSSPTLTNCILWGDTPEEIYHDDETSTTVVTYSDIQGGYPGEGNIDSYPFLVDPANGDFHLGACSPCIDAGDNEASNLPTFDFEGDDRIIDGDDDGNAIVDMGVDEVAVAGTCYPVHLPVVLRNY